MNRCLVFSNVEFNMLMRKKEWNDNNLPDDYAFISICDPNYVDESLDLFHWFKHNSDTVINLDFNDIEDYALPGDGRVKGMSDEQALQLYSFIEKNLGKDFLIHCAAGVSRSQGVAKYITDMYPELYPRDTALRKDNPCEFPNLHVVSLLKHLYYDNH